MIRNRITGKNAASSLLIPAAVAAAVIIAGASCRPQALERSTLPIDRAGVEITAGGSALVRSVYCDISVAPLDEPAWRRILGRSGCAENSLRGVPGRMPPLAMFHVVVRSTVDLPVRVEGAELRHAAGTSASLGVDELRERLSSPSRGSCDLAVLFSFRRVLEERDSPGEIDYRRDTIESRLDFIPPYDSVAGIIAFERIPSGEKNFSLRFLVDAAGKKRGVDIHFKRTERRGRQGRGRS